MRWAAALGLADGAGEAAAQRTTAIAGAEHERDGGGDEEPRRGRRAGRRWPSAVTTATAVELATAWGAAAHTRSPWAPLVVSPGLQGGDVEVGLGDAVGQLRPTADRPGR